MCLEKGGNGESNGKKHERWERTTSGCRTRGLETLRYLGPGTLSGDP